MRAANAIEVLRRASCQASAAGSRPSSDYRSVAYRHSRITPVLVEALGSPEMGRGDCCDRAPGLSRLRRDGASWRPSRADTAPACRQARTSSRRRRLWQGRSPSPGAVVGTHLVARLRGPRLRSACSRRGSRHADSQSASSRLASHGPSVGSRIFRFPQWHEL